MEALGLVLLKSAAWLTGFALVYLLVLRNERYFRLNRIYLLTGIAASLLFPFYTFHYTVVIPSQLMDSASVGELMPGGVVASESALPFYFWIYLAGIVAFLLRLLFQTWKIIRKLKETGYEQTGSVKLVRTSEYASSFSFFSYVFVNPSTATSEMEVIMNHEREHIQQCHWLDLLLVELICIVQWFNPFAWIYVHLVRQNHEYLADEQALQRTVDPVIYQAALLNQLLGAPVFSLTNSFSYSLNKKRFNMMKKKIESPFRKLRMLLVLPLAAMIFYAFAVPEYQYGSDQNTLAPVGKTMNVKGQVLKADGTTPLPGTSVILRGSTIGTITDPEGNFLFKGVPVDGELVFSFVGFKSKVQKVASQPMKIVMEVEKVGIDPVTVTVMGYGTPPPPPPTPAISIRGIDAANPPLIYLDGKIITQAEFNKINPELFESISVLKDKSAIDLYGEKGKYGVILITTKEKAGKVTGEKPASSGQMTPPTGKSGDEEVKVVGYGKISSSQTRNPLGFNIRSIGDANPPLFFLDGIPITKAAMDKINPETIESISVLKDKSATIVYGERAKNGAILIKTKAKTENNSDLNANHNFDSNVNSDKKAEVIGFDKENPPLYFVDGVLMDQKEIGQIKPDMIDNISVLKGKTATDLYGEKGKNGAVMIYTKAKAGSQEGKGVLYSAERVENQDGKTVFVVVEEMPEFPGGSIALRTFIAKAIKYPTEAQKDKIQGKVFVSFVVNSQGKVEQAKIERSVSPALDAEAIRVVNSLPDWKPGKQRGQAVSVAYTIPIEFKVQ